MNAPATQSVTEGGRPTGLLIYDTAVTALAEAVHVDEVMRVKSASEQMKLYARQAKDPAMLANATEIQMRAKRKLGQMIQSAKETGQLGVGRPERSNVGGGEPVEIEEEADHENGSEPEPFTRTTLSEIGIDKKLSHESQKWARLGDADFDAELERTRNRILGDAASAVNGARSVMASRQKAISDLDFFPTPPWATRALVEDVLPQLGVSLRDALVWEPACGEGHITGVLWDYAGIVCGTDVFDYSVDGRSAPAWLRPLDFLTDEPLQAYDWVITNPPFGDKALPFVNRALEVAKTGVAMFFRSQWVVEGVERYEDLFRDNPPTLTAFFVERVNCVQGRWDPDGSTATAYCWLIWLKGEDPRAPFYIPPGRREARWHDDDVERFTAHPVLHSAAVRAALKGLRRAEGGEGGDLPLSPAEVIGAVTEGLTLGGVPPAAVDAVGAILTHVMADAPAGPIGTLAERDAVLREVYGRGAPDFAEITTRTGLTKDQAKKRANHIGVSSRDNQKAAVVASNKARAK